MKQSFTIQRAVVAGDPSAMRAEVVEAIGSEAEAAGVLRSLERMGTDPTIEFFEISPVTGRRTHAGPVSNTWRVHADRGIKEEDESAV